MKLKLAIETYMLRAKFDDFTAIKLIAESGFDAADYSFYWGPADWPMYTDSYLDYARQLRECLDSYGLTCDQGHAPIPFDYGGAFDASNPQWLNHVRAIEASAVLGIKQLIVHTITIPADIKNVDFEDYNLEFFRSFIPFCEKNGVKIAVENLFTPDRKRNTYTGKLHTPRLLCDFVNKLDSDCFTACLDVGHAAITGSEPEDFILGMDKGMLTSLHIQDGDYLADRHILPYTGDFNWNAIMTALRDTGYNGDLTFEIFSYLRRFPNELIPDALRLACAVGRRLIAMFES